MANTKRWHGAALAAVTTSRVAAHAQAADSSYPQRPVRMMVSYPPGGPSDLAAPGIEPEGNSPDEFLVRIKAEIAAWGKVITAAKLPRE